MELLHNLISEELITLCTSCKPVAVATLYTLKSLHPKAAVGSQLSCEITVRFTCHDSHAQWKPHPSLPVMSSPEPDNHFPFLSSHDRLICLSLPHVISECSMIGR